MQRNGDWAPPEQPFVVTEEPVVVADGSATGDAGVVVKADKPFQFRLQSMFWVIGLCACAFALLRVIGPEGFAHLLLALFSIAGIGAVAAVVILAAYSVGYGVIRGATFALAFFSAMALRVAMFLEVKRRSIVVVMSVIVVVGCATIGIGPPLVIGGHGGGDIEAMNDLRNVGLALIHYHQVHGTYPPAYIADANGKPMHSWRVLLLPYLGEQGVYDAYDFSEPWDGPNNSKLHSANVFPYCDRYGNDVTPGMTRYVAIVGKQTMWPPGKAADEMRAGDDAANTLQIVIDPETQVCWCEPRDLEYDRLLARARAELLADEADSSSRIYGAFVNCRIERFTGNALAKIALLATVPTDRKSEVTVDWFSGE